MRALAFGALLAGVLSVPVTAPATEPEQVVVFQSNTLGEDVAAAVTAAARLAGAQIAEFHEGTLRLLRLTRGTEDVQTAPPGMGFPMSTAAFDPDQAAGLVTEATAASLARGEIVFGETSALLRGARVGDVVEIEGWNGSVRAYRVGAIVPDREIEWSELAVSLEEAGRLGFDRPQSIVAWGFRLRDQYEIELLRRLPPDAPLWVLGTGSGPSPDITHPSAVIKQAFGEFAYRPTAGDAVVIDPDWVADHIVTVDIATLGVPFRCHRLLAAPLRGVMAELEARGLAELIDRENFRIAGGCYNPRRTRGNDKGGRISRHAYGAAFDMNTTENVYGGEVGLDIRIADVFRKWGFAWGGAWPFPDGGHFEWKRPPVQGPILVEQ